MDSSIFNFKKREILFLSVTLVVIFAISFIQMRIGQAKTRDAQRKGDLELVSRAINAYLKDNNELPKATTDGKIISCGRKAREECVWGESDIVDPLNVVYLKHIPIDPQAYMGKKYVYIPDLENKKYKIYAILEIDCRNNVQCNYYVGN